MSTATSDDRVSPRDVILRERAAFLVGVAAASRLIVPRAEAVRRYPLPKIERPRVLRDPIDGFEYRTDGKIIEYRILASRWGPFTGDATAARVSLWANLLANPTELVEDEADGR